MYNNCALIGGIICLADVFLLGADSQTDNPVRFVKLCQVRKILFYLLKKFLLYFLVKRFTFSCWIFYMLWWFISKTCPNLSFINKKNYCLYFKVFD
jgi:hypothetical protein